MRRFELLGIILQSVTLFLAPFAIVRNRETGTPGQMFVTPVGNNAVILGKLSFGARSPVSWRWWPSSVPLSSKIVNSVRLRHNGPLDPLKHRDFLRRRTLVHPIVRQTTNVYKYYSGD